MSEFRLQHFTIRQSASAMKVCADSLLFGALIPVSPEYKQALDIGTGTGLLALMIAQRAPYLEQIDTVELTPESAAEAEFNFQSSPWGERLRCYQQDIQSFAADRSDKSTENSSRKKYDLIFSNPPFFADHSKTQTDNRAQELRLTARHTDSLSYADLCASADRLLTEKGIFSVLIPKTAQQEFIQVAKRFAFVPTETIAIQDSEQHPVKVVIIHLQRVGLGNDGEADWRIVSRFQADNLHSSEVQELLGDFLLRYAGSD